jgi:UDP-2,3-diacylglucosamine pyrophosphatase LpxH
VTGDSIWWMVSDLHLDADRPDVRGVGTAFPAFLDEVVRGSGRAGRHLVLLGDTFEVSGGTDADDREAQALRCLQRLGERFSAVFSSLDKLAANGVTVHVVCGNHDIGLARPAVRRELIRMLGATDGSARIHPWLLHVPGLLYAEHGSQHHDLNRMPTLLAATLPGSPGELDLPPLAVLTRGRDRGRGVVTRGFLMARAFVRTARAERRTTDAAYQALLARTAEAQHLPLATVRALADVSRVRPLLTVLSVGRRLAVRRFGGGHDAYLRRAVLRIDDVMRRDDLRTACYAFGHTHVAAREPLPSAGALYANCGTWSQWTREPNHDAASGFPYVVLEQTGPEVQVHLKRWHPARPS